MKKHVPCLFLSIGLSAILVPDGHGQTFYPGYSTGYIYAPLSTPLPETTPASPLQKTTPPNTIKAEDREKWWYWN